MKKINTNAKNPAKGFAQWPVLPTALLAIAEAVVRKLDKYANRRNNPELKNTEWNFSNKILYEMCSGNFTHERVDIIIGKVLMIGRVYSAAIERRKNKAEPNDQFYIELVGPKFRDSDLDILLKELRSESKPTDGNIAGLLGTHLYLTKLIKELTEQEKRSFSSKYLHFHIPELFFLYDTRAVKAMRILGIKLTKKQKKQLDSNNVDLEYAIFFYKCLTLKQKIKTDWNLEVTNRHLDNILMSIVERKERPAYIIV